MTAPSGDDPAGKTGRTTALTARAKGQATARLQRAESWVAATAERRTMFDLAVAVRNRDREAFASVLGSAIALRLFLFTTALVVAIVSALNLIFGTWGLEGVIEGSGITGEVAEQVGQAAEANTGRDLSVFVSSFVVMLWAGRSLTLVLSACSAGAWRMEARLAKASVRVVVRVTALISLVLLAASLLSRLRNEFGVAVATGSLALNILMLGAGWFFVTLSLPRATRDPGALIPGAAAFGILITLTQWFMHFYLPRSIENASETMGSLGVTVATLGYLFMVGRLMAGCVVVNAVLWDRVGSISEFVFRLPWIRRIPQRFPKVAVFFDLDHRHGEQPA